MTVMTGCTGKRRNDVKDQNPATRRWALRISRQPSGHDDKCFPAPNLVRTPLQMIHFPWVLLRKDVFQKKISDTVINYFQVKCPLLLKFLARLPEFWDFKPGFWHLHLENSNLNHFQLVQLQIGKSSRSKFVRNQLTEKEDVIEIYDLFYSWEIVNKSES